MQILFLYNISFWKQEFSFKITNVSIYEGSEVPLSWKKNIIIHFLMFKVVFSSRLLLILLSFFPSFFFYGWEGARLVQPIPTLLRPREGGLYYIAKLQYSINCRIQNYYFFKFWSRNLQFKKSLFVGSPPFWPQNANTEENWVMRLNQHSEMLTVI